MFLAFICVVGFLCVFFVFIFIIRSPHIPLLSCVPKNLLIPLHFDLLDNPSMLHLYLLSYWRDLDLTLKLI